MGIRITIRAKPRAAALLFWCGVLAVGTALSLAVRASLAAIGTPVLLAEAAQYLAALVWAGAAVRLWVRREHAPRVADAASSAFPFGDPCRRCEASASHADPRDRECSCSPCAVCGEPSGGRCAYCGRSLGCPEHRVTIGRHVETYCLATAWERALLDGAPAGEKLPAMRQLQRTCNAKPKPWPMPVPPWDDVRAGRAGR